ncbi:MAG: hypothetical protein M3010_06250 [Candidatus Dormibacteraeota bacterium]|nr:hypothetical protein [Candidatus Dormibacteraeota bacterium]
MSERMDHPTRALPPEAISRGDIRLRVYGRPAAELDRTVGDRVPRWIQRLYESYGADVTDPPLSASMEAIAEGLMHRLGGLALILRRAEMRGWKAEVDDDTLVIYTGIGEDEVRAQLEDDGVLSLVQEFAMRDTEPPGV